MHPQTPFFSCVSFLFFSCVTSSFPPSCLLWCVGVTESAAPSLSLFCVSLRFFFFTRASSRLLSHVCACVAGNSGHEWVSIVFACVGSLSLCAVFLIGVVNLLSVETKVRTCNQPNQIFFKESKKNISMHFNDELIKKTTFIYNQLISLNKINLNV